MGRSHQTAAKTFVHVAAPGDRENQNDEPILLDRVTDATAADPDTPSVFDIPELSRTDRAGSSANLAIVLVSCRIVL